MTTINSTGNKITDGTHNVTLGGNLTTAGAFDTTITATGTTAVTLPTSGTLSTGTLPNTEVTGTSATMASNNKYTANNAALVTLTLPASSAVGDAIEVVGSGAGGWKVAQQAGQSIRAISGGSTISTTTGTGGYIASNTAADCVILTCITANTGWECQVIEGNITIV